VCERGETFLFLEGVNLTCSDVEAKRGKTQRRKEDAKSQKILILLAPLPEIFKTKSAAPSKLKAAQSVFL
jgi:hypothetical protein